MVSSCDSSVSPQPLTPGPANSIAAHRLPSKLTTNEHSPSASPLCPRPFAKGGSEQL